MYKKMVLSSLVAGALLAINGCGGGGSSSDTPIVPAVLSGVAVDDLILNGVVSATDTDGITLATGRTSATDGTYSLNVPYTGIVLLNVVCDENSTMWNPTTPISEAVECGSETTLNSLSNAVSGVETSVNITPLTEVVYQRAAALTEDGNISGVDADDLDEARAEVGLMFNLDPLGDNPVEGDYATIISAINSLATNDTTVIEITQALADALSDGEAEGEEVITDLVEAMVIVDENLTNLLVDTNGTYTPPENAALAVSNVEAAKALFTELRTQAMSVTDYTNSGAPGFLDTETLSMEEALNGAVLNIGYIEEALNTQLTLESRMRDYNLTEKTVSRDARTLTLTLTGPSSYHYEYTEENTTTTWSGTVSYPDINESEIYTFTTLSANIDGTFPLGSQYDESVEVGVQSFNGSIMVNKTTAGASIAIEGTLESNGTSVTLSDATAELAYDENTTTGEPILNYFRFNGVTLQGIVGGYTIDGSITVNSYVQNAGLAELGGLVENFESGFGVNMICTSGITPIISDVSFTYDGVTYSPDSSYTNVGVVGYNFYYIEGDVQYADIMTNLSYTSTGCSETVSVGWNWNDSYMDIANSGWLPDNITFTGAISRPGASIEGILNAKWLNAATIDVENSLEIPFVDVTLNGTLQMPERPEMLMTLSFENNATHNTLGASYTYDTTVINAGGVFDTDMLNGDVAITTHIGLHADIEISNGLIVYGGASTVTKDGLLLGEFEEREGLPIIKYVDGSFESIF